MSLDDKDLAMVRKQEQERELAARKGVHWLRYQDRGTPKDKWILVESIIYVLYGKAWEAFRRVVANAEVTNTRAVQIVCRDYKTRKLVVLASWEEGKPCPEMSDAV